MEKASSERNKREFRVRKEVLEFCTLSKKKYKKDYAYNGIDKKDLINDYYDYLITLIPEVLETYVHYGHIEEIQKLKHDIYVKFTNPGFAKRLLKVLKNEAEINNIEYVPVIVLDILNLINDQKKEQEENKDESSNDEIVDPKDLLKLSSFVLNKKLKKLEKKGIDSSLAFDILSVIPTDKVLERNSASHYLSIFMRVLYSHAKNNDKVEFGKIAKVVFKEERVAQLILFCLLEKKSRLSAYNDTQKMLFNNITEWCFDTLEEFDKEEIKKILSAYIKGRQFDEQRKRDESRRYVISEIPGDRYPKIAKAVNKLLAESDENKKYL